MSDDHPDLDALDDLLARSSAARRFLRKALRAAHRKGKRAGERAISERFDALLRQYDRAAKGASEGHDGTT